MKKVAILISLIAVVGIGAVAIAPSHHDDVVEKKEDIAPITLTFVGDIMMDRAVRGKVEKYLGGDYNALFANTDYLKESDIAFGNLEGSVALGGRNVGSKFSFHMKPESLGALRESGVDIVSFANNHVGDWAMEAFLESLENMKANNILYAGAGENYAAVVTPTIIDVRGTKVGFLAATDVGPNWLKATDSKPGILLANDPNLPQIITNAKAQVDILIMSFHWGNEYSPANSHQQELAHESVDAGADIVIGHHPHVMERVEEYNGKLIYYSLGNYIFDQYFSIHTMRGMVGQVSIDPVTKEIKHTEYVSVLDKNYIPQSLVPFTEDMLITKSFTP